MDAMPFTSDAFVDTLAAYNQALWPLAAALWLVTAAVFLAFVSGRSVTTFVPRILIGGHWLWAGVMYHAFFFTAINPAAWVFAALFVVQGVLLLGVRSVDGLMCPPRGSLRHIVASVLIAYSLLYPLIVWLDGFAYPRMPSFGVPCPTTLLTIGFLIAVSARSFVLSAIPITWSIVGGSGVWLFGVRADIALPAAAALLVIDLIFGRSHVMKKLSFATLFSVLVAMLVMVPASSALAQAAQHDHAPQAQKGAKKMDQMKMGDMKMDAAMMEQMAAKQKANTERLTALMAQVTRTTGDAKVAAMADVIAILVEDSAAMQEHCAAMMKMMGK
jgi:hypothetical protein